MRQLFVLLVVCVAVSKADVLDNVVNFLKSVKSAFEENFNAELQNAVSEKLDSVVKSLQPDIDDINNNLLKTVNITKLDEALIAYHPHADLNATGIIEKYEYKAEVHTVETEDGYILELHRITGNKFNPSPNGKPAVLLMHGILASSVDWILTGPQKGLGFILADAGYDVWMGNQRGNTYSRNHINKKIKKNVYWRFSWHEIGIYDLPATIDYILNVTKNQKLSYVGHSQGTTAFYVMLSERPEYNEKVNVMFSLAPIAYCSNIRSLFLRVVTAAEKLLVTASTAARQYEMVPNAGLYNLVAKKLCGLVPILCRNALFLLAGFDEEQFDLELMPALVAHVPAGGSIFQYAHYAQLVNTGTFQQYNNQLIGTSYPPHYKLQNVKVPISLYYANNDWVSVVKDVEKLKSQLPNVFNAKIVDYLRFNHIDFLYAKDVKSLVYDDLLNDMNKYNNL